MSLRNQMDDLMMKAIEKATEGYMRSDLKRKADLHFQNLKNAF